MSTNILSRCLIPFCRRVYPHGHRFMQDNNPKHTFKRAQKFFEDNGINWWRTPPESPDSNPIENMWHELKEYLRREVKPKNKEELVQEILSYWQTVIVEKCRRYIGHLKKVIPRMIELKGDATGYQYKTLVVVAPPKLLNLSVNKQLFASHLLIKFVLVATLLYTRASQSSLFCIGCHPIVYSCFSEFVILCWLPPYCILLLLRARYFVLVATLLYTPLLL